LHAGLRGGAVYFARYPGKRRTGLYLLPFALAMLSKPPAAVFPVLLVLYCYFFEGLEQLSLRRLREAVKAAVPSIVATVVLLVMQSAMTPKTFCRRSFRRGITGWYSLMYGHGMRGSCFCLCI